MKKVILLAVLTALLAGCEDFPVEPGGEDDFSGAAHHPARVSHKHGGMDDGPLRGASDR